MILSTELIRANQNNNIADLLLSEKKHVKIIREGVVGVWVPETDYKIFYKNMQLLDNANTRISFMMEKINILENQLEFYTSKYENKNYKMLNFQKNLFKITTEFATVSFLVSVGVIAILASYIYFYLK